MTRRRRGAPPPPCAASRCTRPGPFAIEKEKSSPTSFSPRIFLTRIQPYRRWFGNTRVVNQKELEFFREELQSRMSSNYNVILKEKKLPLSLLNDHQKQVRVHLLDREPFQDAFGPKTKRKRPSLLAADYESLLKKADGSQEIKQSFTRLCYLHHN
ncbi:hypothetical protein PHAVU_005G082701 [Phaseolus vulgaris]